MASTALTTASVAKNAAGKVVAAGHHNQHARRTRSPDAENRFIIRVHSWLRLLREALNEGTLRAFRYADRFATFKTFRRPPALRRRLAPGQSRRSDRIGWSEWGRQINVVCPAPRPPTARDIKRC